MEVRPHLVAVLGPTAIGKTSLSIQLAKTFEAEIISADSRQLFKELSIGTAKPSSDEQMMATHHFIDHLSIQQEYNASTFEKEALTFLEQYFEKKDLAILCGGSGMYVNALLNGFDEKLPSAEPKLRRELNEQLKNRGIESLQAELKSLDPVFYAQVDLNNSKRLIRAIEICKISGVPYSSLRLGVRKDRPFHIIKVGLEMSRSALYERINQRVDKMMVAGLLDEVKSVNQYRDHNALNTVGYRELFPYLDGEISLEKAVDQIKVNSRRYAKRQISWFKRDKEIKWFEPSQKKEIIQYIRNSIEPS